MHSYNVILHLVHLNNILYSPKSGFLKILLPTVFLIVFLHKMHLKLGLISTHVAGSSPSICTFEPQFEMRLAQKHYQKHGWKQNFQKS